jgi:3'-5' exoribonuclease
VLDDPRDDDTPTTVEQTGDHGSAETARTSSDNCSAFHRLPSAGHSIFVDMKVRQFAEGTEVSQPLLVREVEVRTRRDGDDYLRIVFGDRSGTVPATVWDSVSGTRELCERCDVVHVTGQICTHPRFGAQLVVHGLRPARPDEYDRSELVDGPSRTAEQMEADLRELMTTIHNPHLRRLLNELFGEGSATWVEYREKPAAKHYHQAYRHGLLEHSLTVAQAVSAVSAIFPGIDRDMAVTGALLHDIGKLDAYSLDDTSVSMSDNGRLYGEIPAGYYRVRRTIERLYGFPPELEQALLHIILSHHGSLEHGSPVVPCTREATLVHMMDNLGGRLGSFDRLEQQLPAGALWSAYDKGIGGGAYFGAPPEAERQAA